jgi:glycosyltransferase involved in cell wall biosynthesis
LRSRAVPDLTVLGQEPRYGGGARAQIEAFLKAARSLGRDPKLVFTPHPTFDGRVLTVDRIEALRLRRGRPALDRPLWVVAATAHHGAAAATSGLPYDCWIGTSLEDEWRGRSPTLRLSRRLAQRANAPALRRLERDVLHRARRVFATSSWSSATVAKAGGLDPDAVRILPLPVDLEAFAPEPDAEWFRRLNEPVLAFVGRADDPRKNIDLLLDAVPLLPEVRVRLIGTPPQRALPSRVEALGPVASVAEHLRTATLLVLPSRQEGFGIVAAEALAAGVPVLATRSGGPEELIERSGGGRLLDGWQAGELAAACRELLEDAATLTMMRQRGREYVAREHSPERLRASLAEVLI